jgi:hypothetical protein
MMTDPNIAVRAIIQNAIAEVMNLGVDKERAVMLLAFQLLIRVEDIEDLQILRDEAQTNIDAQLEDARGLH